MMNIDEKELAEINQKKALYFFNNKIPVHISLKTSRWANGEIKEFFSDGFVLKEFVEGEIPIFYIEILPNGINAYNQKGEKK